MKFHQSTNEELVKALRDRLEKDSDYEIEFFGHAIKFLNVLDPTTDQWTFQTFDDTQDKKSSLIRTFHGSLIEHFETLWQLNKQGAGIFITVNETDFSGRKKSNIRRIRAVFSDHDNADPSTPNRVSNNYLTPSMIVESSDNKFHAYWLVKDCDMEDFPLLQKAIAEKLDSDKSVNDVSRVLRLPGFRHQKAKPVWVKLHSVNTTTPFSVVDITNDITSKMISIAPEMKETVIQPATSKTKRSSTKYGLSAVDKAIQKVACAPEGERNNTLNRETFGIAQLVASGEISQEDSIFIPTNLIMAAESIGLTDGEIRQTVSNAWDSGIRNARKPTKLPTDAANDDTNEPALRTVQINNYMHSEVEPTKFVIQQILPKRHVTLLSGHGGIGKSVLGLVMAAHVASGNKFFGLQCEYQPTLFVSLEDEGSICIERLKKITKAYALDISSIEKNLRIIDGTGNRSVLLDEPSRYSDGTEFTTTFTELENICKQYKPALIVIDNSSNSFGANENVRKDVVCFLTGLAQLAKENNASILLLAHVDKGAAKFGGNGNTYSGSTAWNNSVRSRLALTNDETVGKIRLIHEKANHSSLINDRLFEFGAHGVPVPCKPPSKEEKEQRLNKDKEIIIESIKRANENKINIGASVRPGNGSAMNCLSDVRKYSEYFENIANGKQRASAAIKILIDEGNIQIEEYKNSSYQIKKRLKIKE